MKPTPEATSEILRGLEGIEMLCQWQKTLAEDLRRKVEALMKDAEAGASTSPDKPS